MREKTGRVGLSKQVSSCLSSGTSKEICDKVELWKLGLKIFAGLIGVS